MRYVPKNRIKKGLVTKGLEFVYKNTSKAYTGPYVELYDGTYYTDENLTQELIKTNSNINPGKTPLGTDGLIYNYTKNNPDKFMRQQ